MGKDRWRTGRGWGRRLAIGTGFLVVGAAVVFFALLWAANNRFDAKIRSYQASGTPILPADFTQAKVPDDRNAALVYIQAGDATKALADEQGQAFQKHFTGEFPLTGAQRALARDAVAKCAEPLRLLRVARGMPQMCWDIPFVSPVSQTFAGSAHQQRYNAMRSVANVLRAAAVDALDRGEHAAGVEYLLDIAALARATDNMPPTLITHMVANGIDATAAETALDAAPDLPAGAAEPTRRLIAALFDNHRRTIGMAAAWDGERMIQADTIKHLAGQSPVGGMLFKMDGVRLLNLTDQVRGAAEQPTLPAARAIMGPPAPRRGLSQFTRPLSGMMWGSFDRALQSEAEMTALRRAAATALALRLYALDHDGELPPQLADIVLKYLPMLPMDPFRPISSELVYRPAGDDPRIYSVGLNGMDDGGSEQLTLQGLPKPTRWDYVDFVFHLKRQPPTTQPAEE